MKLKANALISSSCKCNVWFGVSTKKRNSMLDLWELSILDRGQFNVMESNEATKDVAIQRMERIRRNVADNMDRIRAYRNVSLAESAVGPSERIKAHPSFRNDALEYLDRTKARFNSSPELYNGIYYIMKDLQRKNIDTSGFILRVIKLMGDNEDLVERLNRFLPPGWSANFAEKSARHKDGFFRSIE